PAAWIHRRLLERCRQRGLLPAPASQPAWQQNLPADLRSDGLQTGAHAFYSLFGDVMESRPSRDDVHPAPVKAIRGSSTLEIAAALGKPTRVRRVQVGEDEWLQVTYSMERCPSAVAARSEQAWKSGWRYSPTLYFHNRQLSSYGEFVAQTGADKYQL